MGCGAGGSLINIGRRRSEGNVAELGLGVADNDEKARESTELV